MSRARAVGGFNGAIARHVSDERGTVVLIFALSFFILVGTVGGAVDYARWQHSRSQVQSAVDASVLAAGRTFQMTSSETEAIAAATQYFNNIGAETYARGQPSFTMMEGGTAFSGIFDGAVRTSFLGVMGIAELPVYVKSEAVISAGGNSETNIEISMVLDITGSMSGQKIADMQAAAKDLVDIVVWDDQSQYTSKVALAPFARRVNVGDYMKSVSGLPDKSFGAGLVKPITCVTERTGSEEFTDAAPNSSADWISAYTGDSGSTALRNPANYSDDGTCANPSSNQQIMPLTSDKSALKSRIDAFTADGSTAGALGTAWGWYLISPKWSTVWTGSSQPAPYSDLTAMGPTGQPKLKKYVILMTDGVFNTYAGVQNWDGSTEAVTISGKATQLCSGIKAAGVKVYSVGFALGGSQLAIDTLKSCASREASDPADQPSYFYNASTGEELRQAFREIALQIATLRLRS